MKSFSSPNHFPSLKPIRVKASKVIYLVDNIITNVENQEDIKYLNELKQKALDSNEDKLFYFTISQAKLLNIIK